MAESAGSGRVVSVPLNDMGVWTASTAVESPHLRLANDGDVMPDHSYEVENIHHEGVAPKRKRSSKGGNGAALTAGGRHTPSGRGSLHERQKITRACDACKTYEPESRELDPARLIFFGRRKSRCSGTLPCNRCRQLSITCKYESPHKRGRPPSPPRGNPILLDREPQWPAPQPQQPQPVTLTGDDLVVQSSELREPEAAVEALYSSRSSPARDATNVEGQYIGPTSGLAFFHRAKGRLRQDFSSSTRNAVDSPRGPSSIFTFGDKPYPDFSGSILILPSRQQAREHVKRYFEFAIPTYRFLHQSTIEGWLETFMTENETTGKRAKPLSDGKAAVVLMVLATSMLYRVDDTAALHDAEAEEYDQR